jgi:plastocyanin
MVLRARSCHRLALIALCLAGLSRAASAADIVVKIDNFAFSPAEVTVHTGDTVTWVNNDDIPHTIVSQPIGSFRSKPLDTEDKFTFTFEKTGAFDYFCSLHPHMKGRIVVAPQS